MLLRHVYNEVGVGEIHSGDVLFPLGRMYDTKTEKPPYMTRKKCVGPDSFVTPSTTT